MMRWKFWDRTNPEIPEYDPGDEPAPLGDVHRRGEAATRLLGDPTLAEAFEALRRDLYDEWLASEPAHTTRREELYYEARTLNQVASKLRAYIAAARIRRDSAA